MLIELNETARGSAERQLYTLMYQMISRKDVEKMDIITRCRSIMDGIYNLTAPN